MPDARPVVLVTGGNGFLGSHVIEAMAARYDVVALDHHASDEPSAHAEFVGIDVTSDASVQAALARVRASKGGAIASVVHLAAFFDLTNEDDPRYRSVTVQGTARLLKALQGFEVEQFIFMSTLLVHAPSGHGRRIDEDSPLDDRFPYRNSKIQTERLLPEERGKIPTVVLRAAGVYDEMCHAAFLDHQIASIYEDRATSHVYPGELATGQPYVHVEDLLDAIGRAVERRHELPPESTFLIGETDVMGYGEIQDAAGLALHGHEWSTRRIPAPLAAAGAWMQDKVFDEDPFVRPWMVEIASDHYEIDISRARQLLGWQPRHSLRSNLPTMLARLKADPVAWYATNHLDTSLVAGNVVAPSDDSANGTAGSSQANPGAAKNGMGDKGYHSDMQSSMRSGHFDMLWVHWVNILLGAWLVASPFAFGSFDATEFTNAVRQVTNDRHLMDPTLRSLLLARSDVLSGLLIMLFGGLSLSPRFSWAQWANAAMGCWLLFAPLVFWAPTAAAYTNDTFVGALVIAFAVLVPMMPSMSMAGMMDSSDLPPGWSYSPSTYLQRLPIIALGLFGFLLSRILTAYQLGHITGVWEPFFAGSHGLNGTETIITSSVSKAWPIPDAGLGGVAYVFEVLMGVMGDRRRWRTMPWMVAMFGIVVVPLGVVSITFIVIQPIVIGTWCTLCLMTAAAMLVMIPYSFDELVAMGQFLVQDHRRGGRFWSTFFRGNSQPEGKDGKQSGFDAPLGRSVANAVRGVTLPWTLVVSALLGALLMLTRVFFGTTPPLANSDHLVGALVLTFAVMAMAEVGRPLRFVNVAFGVWLLAAGWVTPGGTGTAAVVDTVVGVLVIVLSLPRGKRSDEHYGSWDRFVV